MFKITLMTSVVRILVYIGINKTKKSCVGFLKEKSQDLNE